MTTTFLRLPDVMRLTGLKKSSIYQKIQSGVFVSQIKWGYRTAVWLDSEIEALNRAISAGKTELEIRALVTALEAQRVNN